MKNIAPILAGILLALGAGVFIASAQDYTPLAPLPGTFTGEKGAETTNIGLYLSGAITLLIAVSGALAVLMMIIGGTQYVASGIAPPAKNDAKARIWNAVIGLVLVLVSYLILNSINPNLVKFKLTLPQIAVTAPAAAVTVVGELWQDDSSKRAELHDGGGQFNNKNCAKVGDENCTSVFGLPQNAINKLIGLKNSCGVSCSVTVTGGTEYWLHKTHGSPGEFVSVVDLRYDYSAGYILNDWIKDGTGPKTGVSCGISSADHYYRDGMTFVLETVPNKHWHVCL